ncbi:MAG: trypsin-like peptidase domain-containing protein [Chloroflexota bacterium]
MTKFVKKGVTAAIIVMIAVFAFYIGTSVSSGTAQGSVIWPAVTPQPVSFEGAVLDSERAYANIYNGVGPSVVSINVVARTSSNGIGQDQLQQGTGTGFVIDQQGHIVTNNHVVQGAIQVEVNFFDGSIYRGEVVGVDPDSDLAVIQVDRPAEDLHPVALGDSDGVFIGEEVVAMGSPFGQPWTLTTGVISALNRSIDSLGQYQIGSVIQTDAAINPGNSGGPLINMNGEVIGVNSQILSQTRSSSGIGFAIPSNLVKRVSAALIANGAVSYSYLGIQGGSIDLSVIEALNLPNNARGVVVSGVVAGGPAGLAGLQNATTTQHNDGTETLSTVDIITAVNGTPVTSMESLIAYLSAATKPGDTITLSVVRNGSQQLELPVTLTARPSGN